MCSSIVLNVHAMCIWASWYVEIHLHACILIESKRVSKFKNSRDLCHRSTWYKWLIVFYLICAAIVSSIIMRPTIKMIIMIVGRYSLVLQWNKKNVSWWWQWAAHPQQLTPNRQTNWQIQFPGAYVLPVLRGSDISRVSEVSWKKNITECYKKVHYYHINYTVAYEIFGLWPCVKLRDKWKGKPGRRLVAMPYLSVCGCMYVCWPFVVCVNVGVCPDQTAMLTGIVILLLV